MEKTMVRAKLVDYFDVWGNKKDGWEINNLCTAGHIDLPEDFTEKDIVKAIKEFGFFAKHVRANMLDIEMHLYPYIEINQAKDFRPICRIEIFED